MNHTLLQQALRKYYPLLLLALAISLLNTFEIFKKDELGYYLSFFLWLGIFIIFVYKTNNEYKRLMNNRGSYYERFQ